jgi:hypothetical protein
MKLSSDERQEVFNFMVERHDLRFLIHLINIARGENAEVVSSAYQSIGDIFTAYPGILEDKFDANGKQTQRGLTRSSFAASAGYADQTDQADEVLLNFIAQDPEGTPQTSLIFSRFWRADELCHIYNGLDPNSGLAKFIKDVMMGRTFLGIINSHLTSGEIQDAGRFSFFLHDDLYARGQINVLPKEYVSFFASPGWRGNMGILRLDVLTGAQQIVEGQISTGRDHPHAGAVGRPRLYPVANPVDSLALLRSMGPELQKDYIDNLVAKKNIPELARIYENWTILNDPDLFNVVGDALQESLEGRLWKFQIYLRSPDEKLRNVIKVEVTQNIDVVKQDATAIKNPGAMRIFRTAVKEIHDNNLGLSWLMETFRDTFSFIEAASSQDPEAQKAKAEAATREALVIMRDLYPPVFEKDSFIVGEPAYTGTKIDLLNRIAERLNSLNTPEELEQYLNEQAVSSPENQKTIDELRKYRDDILNGNHQGITKGVAMKGIEWLYHTNFLSVLLITLGASYTLLPIFWDWKVRKSSSLEKLMDISERKSLNDKRRNGKGIDRKRLEPRVVNLITKLELKDFSKNGVYTPEVLLNYQEDINKIVDGVMDALPYTPDLMDSEAHVADNQAYQDSYSYLMNLVSRKIDALADHLKSEDLTPAQRKQYRYNTLRMFLNMIDVEKYLDILQGRVNTNTSINEHFHKEYWLEKINKLTTWIFGIDFIAHKPLKKLEPDLRDLMETRKLVNPDTYKDIDGYVSESLKRLGKVIFEGKRFGSYGYAETSDNSRKLKLFGRLLFLVPTAYFVTKSIFGLFGVIPFNLLDIFSSIGTLCLALAIQWGPILANNRAAYNKRMKEIMIRLYNKTNESLGSGEKVNNWKSLKRKVKYDWIQLNGGAQAAADSAVISSPTKSNGGIDLNFQPQFIQRSSQTSFTPIQGPVMPDGFKGFNFNIVRFTSNLTVNGAVQLMFNPN